MPVMGAEAPARTGTERAATLSEKNGDNALASASLYRQ